MVQLDANLIERELDNRLARKNKDSLSGATKFKYTGNTGNTGNRFQSVGPGPLLATHIFFESTQPPINVYEVSILTLIQ